MVANPDFLADNSDGSSLVKQYFCLAELVDDLFRRISLFSHLFPLLRDYNWYRFRGSEGNVAIAR